MANMLGFKELKEIRLKELQTEMSEALDRLNCCRTLLRDEELIKRIQEYYLELEREYNQLKEETLPKGGELKLWGLKDYGKEKKNHH